MRQRNLNLESELQLAIELARKSGDLLRAEFHRPGGPRADGVASAPIDLELEQLIREGLQARFPGDGIVGEEMKSTLPKGARRTWYLDPHDGTRAFLRGERGSAVSIALVVDGEPALGVVYAPTAPDDGGDLIAWAKGAPLTRNGLVVERLPLPSKLTSAHIIAMNTDAAKDPERSAVIAAPARFISCASIAYRLALVAVGEADAAVSWSGPTHYDVAAGHALLRAVGGDLVDAHGRPFTYGAGGTGNTDVYGAHPMVAPGLAARGRPGARMRTPQEKSGLAARYPHVVGEPLWSCTNAAVLARAQGALLGQVAGDALGQLVEFRSRSEVARSHPDGVRELVDGGTWGTIAGQPTDDSEMALIMARSIVREGGYKAAQVQVAYVDWLRSAPFDVGNTTRRGLTGNPDMKSEANGSLMRLSPLAVHLWRQELEVVAVTVAEDARITHPSDACVDAAVVFAAAIGIAVREGPSPRALYDRVSTWVRSRPDLHEGVREIFVDDDVAPVTDFSHHSGWVLLALRNAFHQLLHAASFEDALVSTASQGGDADTTSAIAGALLGAVHGRDAVPLRWRRLVLSCRPGLDEHARHRRPSPFWPDDLLLLAERLVALGPPPLLAAQPEGVVSLAQHRQRSLVAMKLSAQMTETLNRVRQELGKAVLDRAAVTGALEEWGLPDEGGSLQVRAEMLVGARDACTAALGRALVALDEAAVLIRRENQ